MWAGVVALRQDGRQLNRAATPIPTANHPDAQEHGAETRLT